MGKHTSIQWCDGTVNCTSGCGGCELWVPGKGGSCYAGAIHTRFSPSKAYPGPFERISLHPGRMAQAARWGDLTGKPRPDKPWLDGMPRMIFVSDMSDALSKDVPFEYLFDEVILNAVSPHGRRHLWLWLTKLPHRMAEFAAWLRELAIDWPENLWAGTSITSMKTIGRPSSIVNVPAAVRFLSVEPMWGHVDLGAMIGIHWVICGGESYQNRKGYHHFNLDWARSLRDQCEANGVPFFMKQMGSLWIMEFDPPDKPVIGRWKDSHGGDWDEWPEDLRVRRMPRVPVPECRA